MPRHVQTRYIKYIVWKNESTATTSTTNFDCGLVKSRLRKPVMVLGVLPAVPAGTA